MRQLIKIIEKHYWWLEETPATHQVAEWAWRCFCESSKYFNNPFPSVCFSFYINDHGYELTPRDEKFKQFDFLLKQEKKNSNYLRSRRSLFDSKERRLLSNGWKLVNSGESYTRKKLSKLYQEIAEEYCDTGRLSLFIECIDPYTEDVLPVQISKLLPGVDKSKIMEIANVLCSPNTPSFMDKERRYFLEACLIARKNNSQISELAANLENKYVWILTNYGEAKPKKAQIFINEIKSYNKKHSIQIIKNDINKLRNKEIRIRKEKFQLYRKYPVLKKLNPQFKIISESGNWIDARKKLAMQMTFIIYRLLERFENILKAPHRLLAYATNDELSSWLAKNKPVPVSVLKARSKFSCYFARQLGKGKSATEFITGKTARELFKEFFPKQKSTEFKGTVASPAKKPIIGKVNVVFNTAKDSFEPGAILVTTMTRPDFLPLMRQAKAIITDEGGLTCHAAIVSRELKIPCVIGTKIATKVLKTGDRVEIDTDKGLVKKLNK